MTGILDIRNLSVEYFAHGNRVEALRGIDLCIEKGESVGIVGESGCGKSTLAAAIFGLIDKSEGRINADKIGLFDFESNREINLLNLKSGLLRNMRGRKISLILQDPYGSLNPVIKIEKQLKEAYLIHNPHAKQPEMERVIREKLNDVQLQADKTIYESYPHQLSGGMLQRVSIAIALLNSPGILIADEPTSNLDVTIQEKIIDNLKDLRNKLDLSLIFITHNLNLVSEFADRIYIFYAGLVMEYGPASEIFKNPVHPYTKGLLRAVPSIRELNRKIKPIAGSVPSPSDVPAGCGFAPRCEDKVDVCSGKDDVNMLEVGAGHYVRCRLSG